MNRIRVRRALISVADKTGLAGHARRLTAMGVEIVSTGGSAKALEAEGIPVRDIASLTGAPPLMGGRIKTLHPAVHAALLMRRDDADDIRDADEHDVKPIDLVYVTLYPFADRVRAGADAETCIEHIDIGGHTMMRAAAKNASWVAVCAHADQLDATLEEMEQTEGATTLALRRRLAASVFAYTARYETDIAEWYGNQTDVNSEQFFLTGHARRPLRHGENPHQKANLYKIGDAPGVASARAVQGKALSYNNIADLDAALALVNEFTAGNQESAAVIVKHCIPCGAALADTPAEALSRARQSDPVSAFGGVIALNRTLDAEAAAVLTTVFTEAVAAPDVTPEALEVLAAKPDLRVLVTKGPPIPAPDLQVKSVSGGLLVQECDSRRITASDLRIVTKAAFDPVDMRDALFAWTVVKHARSNAIVFARDGAVIGMGCGQTSRVDAVRQAVQKAGERAHGGFVVASDGFFPFADGVVEATSKGARAIIQPGGSIRDAEVVTAADGAGIAMAFTGIRHFRH